MDYKLTNCRTTGTADHLGCLAQIISQEILFTEILSHTQKIVLLIILSAFLFPVPLTAFMTLPFPIESEAANFNEYFSYVMGYGVELLLPCVIGITNLADRKSVV